MQMRLPTTRWAKFATVWHSRFIILYRLPGWQSSAPVSRSICVPAKYDGSTIIVSDMHVSVCCTETRRKLCNFGLPYWFWIRVLLIPRTSYFAMELILRNSKGRKADLFCWFKYWLHVLFLVYFTRIYS